MITPISIESVALTKWDIATYTQFQQEMYRILANSGLDLPRVFRITTDDMTRWHADIQVLVDINKVIRATVNTEKLAEIDALRDKIITRLFALIKWGLESFSDDEVAAAKRLDLIRKKYNGIQKLNYDRQTASVDGLLTDLGTPAAVADLSQMAGAMDLVKRLSQANVDFRQLYGETSNRRATSQLPTYTQLRKVLNPLWASVAKHIEAGYIFAASDAERKQIETLQDQMNQRIKQIRDAFNRSQSKGGTTKKADGE